jgi:hypothetical protein
MSIFKLTLGVLFNVAIFGVFLFVPAGTLDWWRAWVFLGVVFIGAVASTAALFRVSEELLGERFKPPIQKGQPLADKIVLLLLLAEFLGLIALIPLDVFRFHLLAKPGTLASWIGLVLFVAGWWIMFYHFAFGRMAAEAAELCGGLSRTGGWTRPGGALNANLE